MGMNRRPVSPFAPRKDVLRSFPNHHRQSICHDLNRYRRETLARKIALGQNRTYEPSDDWMTGGRTFAERL
jgi:hypothetical protein